MSVILPADRLFYELFMNAGSNIEAMGKTLVEYMNTDDLSGRNHCHQALEDLEARNDEVTHELFRQLGRNFITPFPREDIHELSGSLDDVADHIYALSRMMQMHPVNLSDAHAREMALVISRSTSLIYEVIRELKTMRRPSRMMKHITLINRLEEKTETLFDSSIQDLFRSENDFRMLMLKRDVYSILEQTAEKCKNVGRVLKQIIIKSA